LKLRPAASGSCRYRWSLESHWKVRYAGKEIGSHQVGSPFGYAICALALAGRSRFSATVRSTRSEYRLEITSSSERCRASRAPQRPRWLVSRYLAQVPPARTPAPSLWFCLVCRSYLSRKGSERSQPNRITDPAGVGSLVRRTGTSIPQAQKPGGDEVRSVAPRP
jgi:hypothetical protein